jgi:hypothetical protein
MGDLLERHHGGLDTATARPYSLCTGGGGRLICWRNITVDTDTARPIHVQKLYIIQEHMCLAYSDPESPNFCVRDILGV